MQVIDEVSGKARSLGGCREVVVGQVSGQIILGFVSRGTPVDDIVFVSENGEQYRLPALVDRLKDVVVFSNRTGQYISKVGLPPETLLLEMYIKGTGRFPYHFEKRYEACENFERFEGKQRVLNPDAVYQLAPYLKYTFGLEFETSQGYVPEDICFRDGLIPLRDGSISGIEYSTVVLSGNEGIALLEQQLGSLRKYTDFDKECSLHIHLGGFPLNRDNLFDLYLICRAIEPELLSIVPDLTFDTSRYKANGKDYCKRLPSYRSFDQMYEHLVGRKFFNDLTQPHPNDIRREAKWRIPTRYFWVNFINALCYNVNKTIEFRFLRPTYNFQKIILWLYILNAIMRLAEEHPDEISIARNGLSRIIRRIYPVELADKIILGITKLKVVVHNQKRNGDHIGQNIYVEEEMFSESLGI